MSSDTPTRKGPGTPASLTHEPDMEALLRAVAFAPDVRRPRPPPLQPGSRVGHYDVIEYLGEGAMGVVYRAFDMKLERHVALKCVAHSSYDTPERIAKVTREATTLATLEHPNLVSVYSIESVGGVVFITMELVPGQSLRERISAGLLSSAELRRGARELIAGLAAAHERGIIHRDIKPDNIRVREDGRYMLLDFGLARRAEGSTSTGPDDAGPSPSSSSMTVTNIAGTPAYMAPEQRRGREIDARVDVWALGLVLLEMAAGSRELAPANVRRLPPSLRGIVRRCLRERPERRYANAVDMRQALERRGRLLPLGAALVAVCASAAALARGLAGDPCAVHDDLFADIWDDTARARIAARIQQTSPPEAAHLQARIETHFERYVERWSTRRVEACERSSQAQREEAVEARAVSDCLDGLRVRLAAISSSLQQSMDAPSLLYAADALADLEPPSSCRAVEPRWQLAEPHDPTTALELDRKLFAARSALSVGDYERALELAREVEVSAHARADHKLEVKATLAEAAVKLDGFVFDEATRAALAAHTLAVTAGDEDGVGDALLMLMRIYHREGDIEQARTIETIAGPHFERLGPRVRLHFASERATIAMDQRRFNDAKRLLDDARTLATETYGPAHMSVANIDYAYAGVALYAGDALDEVLAHYDRAYDIYVAEQGELGHRAAGALVNIGIVHRYRGDFEAALDALTRARDTFEALYGPDDSKTLLATGALSDAYIGLGQTEQAVKLLRASITGRTRNGEGDGQAMVDSKTQLARTLYRLGKRKEPLELARDAYEREREMVGDDAPRALLARAFSTTLELETGSLSDAAPRLAELREHAAKLAAEQPPPYELGPIYAYLNTAYDRVAAHESALEIAELAGELSTGADPESAIDVDVRRGRALAGLGRLTEARQLLEATLTKYEADASSLGWIVAQAHLVLADVLADLEQPALARQHYAAVVELMTDDPHQRAWLARAHLGLAQLGGPRTHEHAQAALTVFDALDYVHPSAPLARQLAAD